MNRRLISCLLLVLLALQSVAASVSAHSFLTDAPPCHDAQMMAHDDSTDQSESSSDCCDNGCRSAAGCSVYCVAQLPTNAFAISFVLQRTKEPVVFVPQPLDDPGYIPLNPPPIA